MKKEILPANTVLMVIDLQKGIDHPCWGKRNNLKAEEHTSSLLSYWRKLGWPIYHIRHNSTEPDSPYRPEQSGNDFKPEVAPLPNETIIIKRTNSAFIETNLENMLHESGFNTLVITGVSTSNSVEATVRMAGNLGFKTYLVSDATFTFEKTDWSGRYRSAEEVHDMSLANMNNEYCIVKNTDEILEMLK